MPPEALSFLKYEHYPRFTDVLIAYKFKLTLAEVRALPEEDRDYMEAAVPYLREL